MPSPDYRHKLQEESYGNPREIIEEELAMKNDFELDLSDIRPSQHKWVRRGCILSCEGASHQSHRHFIKDKRVNTDLTTTS